MLSISLSNLISVVPLCHKLGFNVRSGCIAGLRVLCTYFKLFNSQTQLVYGVAITASKVTYTVSREALNCSHLTLMLAPKPEKFKPRDASLGVGAFKCVLFCTFFLQAVFEDARFYSS